MSTYIWTQLRKGAGVVVVVDGGVGVDVGVVGVLREVVVGDGSVLGLPWATRIEKTRIKGKGGVI